MLLTYLLTGKTDAEITKLDRETLPCGRRGDRKRPGSIVTVQVRGTKSRPAVTK